MKQNKKLRIEQIREWLSNNPDYFSGRNNCKPEEIKSTKKYWLIGDCRHEFEALPNNVIYDDRIHCPVCAGRIVIKGVNDIATTAPGLVKYLKDKDDSFKYTSNSNINLEWKCPDCNDEWVTSPNKMMQRKQLCRNCGDYNKYPEKFVSNFLDQLCEIYSHDIEFDWSDKKRYDFYLPMWNMIIETHGKQHYSESFFYKGARNLYEEQENDFIKKELALHNKIAEYIELDCSKSDPEWIKKSIYNSLLRPILMFDMEDIDWDECEKFALSNIVKEICDDYENGIGITLLIEKYDRCHNTIVSYLKRGAKFGWCSYDPIVSKQQGNGKTVKKMIERTAKKSCPNGHRW